MDSSSVSLFLADNNLENTQNLPSKGDESKVSTNNDIEESGQYDITDTYSSQKLWGIDLILKNITDYLSISDLKELSLVNQHFLEKVRNISRFRSSAGQIVAGEMKIHTFNLCRAVVKVNTLDDNILQKSAADIFQNTEYLELRNDDQPGETGCSRLIQIVANCPKLKSLVFQRMNYFCGNREAFFTNENVKSVFSNLKELHIEMRTDRAYTFQHTFYSKTTVNVGEILQNTFKYFPDLQMKLTKFCYTYYDPFIDVYYFFPELLLRSSEETLEELEITFDCDGFDAMKTMQFPKLKKLHLTLFERSSSEQVLRGYCMVSIARYVADTLVPFLRIHISTLCEFVFESINRYSLTPFCELFRSSKKIEVLQFGGRSSFGKSLRSTNWDFLSTNSKFRDFKLSMDDAEEDYDYDADYDAVYYVEEEQEVENEEEQRIFIRLKNTSNYIPKYLDAFPSTIESIEFDHANTNDLVEIPTAILTSSLERLKNLTSLKVRNCRPFLNDDNVQFICQHLTKLRIFEGNFKEVTDFGISGVRGNGEPDSGISLANLKGLRKLTICALYYCGLRVTWSGLHKAICFLELAELNISGFQKYDLTASHEEQEEIKLNCLILINKSRNPSLEHIDIDIRLPDTFDRKQFPRVKMFSQNSPSTWYAEMLKGSNN